MMTERKTRPSLLLDSTEMELLLSDLHGGDLVADTVRLRLRYLQRNSFPAGAVSGRGKRAMHDLFDIVRLVLAFELLDLGVPPQRAIATVQVLWPSFATSVVAAWRALRLPHREGLGQELDDLRRIALVYPRNLDDGVGTMSVLFFRPSRVAQMVISREGELRGSMPIDLLSVVSALDRALGEDPFGYRRSKVDAAFRQLALDTFNTETEAEWLPRL